MGYSEKIAAHLSSIGYDDIPAAAVDATKRSILDTLGVMLPPSTLEKNCISLAEMAADASGKPESTMVGFGGKVPAWMAAFVNGSMCHPLDYDDTVDEPPHHPTASTLPAALAIAEKVGGVTGKDLITAITLANDMAIRLAAAPRGELMSYPWFPITTFGVFSSAAAAGKLLDLNETQMLNALGIALHHVVGYTAALTAPESDLRAVRDGFTNKAGVICALMASKDIAACHDPFERLYNTLYKDSYDPAPVTKKLGKYFRGVESGLKPWPACRETHGYIQASLEMRSKHNIKPDQIEEVIVTVSEFGGNHLCIPVPAKQNPTLSIGAKFSLPFVVGVALSKGEVRIAHFLPQNLKDPEVLAIARKVKHKVDPSFGALTNTITEIKLKDGRKFSMHIEKALGNPDNPLSTEFIISKFKDCVSYSRKPVSSANTDKLVKKLLSLEKVKDVKEITAFVG